MSANRIDIVVDKGWFVKISDLNKHFVLVNLTKIYCNYVGTTPNIKTKWFFISRNECENYF